MNKHNFSAKVIAWYQANKRELPWRQTRDPYHIWLSEIILQQTRVAQGMPYYFRFIETFSSIKTLAEASEEKVLSVWQGLGYYSRARNLHKCARVIQDNFNGQFPPNYHELIKLPGIGPYTAAAIASICFNEPVAVIDGNVFRLFARYFGIEDDISIPATRSKFQHLGNELIATTQPESFNQAIMEFGALHCTPRQPNCNTCVLEASCFARHRNMQEVLPVKSAKVKVKQRYIFYLVQVSAKGIWMKQRINEGIWEGMYDFPAFEFEKEPKRIDIMKQLALLNISKKSIKLISPVYKHVLTHQVLFVSFLIFNENAELERKFLKNLKIKTFEALADLPKPVLIQRFLKDAQLLK
ncbi:MAG TPA: A/G-specific adenine glycosylase [Cyclobacteriaceae bacterium]|nr:A/G-specific adenine glycosylase [Cyclobacteriaceae bacterium]